MFFYWHWYSVAVVFIALAVLPLLLIAAPSQLGGDDRIALPSFLPSSLTLCFGVSRRLMDKWTAAFFASCQPPRSPHTASVPVSLCPPTRHYHLDGSLGVSPNGGTVRPSLANFSHRQMKTKYMLLQGFTLQFQMQKPLISF